MITKYKRENLSVMSQLPEISNQMALQIGNALFVPSDESNAKEPWKMFSLDIDGKDCLFFCKRTHEPKHIKDIVPAQSFDEDGLRYIFRFCPPPIEFAFMLATEQKRVLIFQGEAE